MATLNTQQISRNGVKPTYAAATAGGDAFTVDERTFLHIKNGSGAAVTVTVTPVATIDGLSLAPMTISVPAADERMAGPFPSELFRDPATGLTQVTYSASASVTIAALRR